MIFNPEEYKGYFCIRCRTRDESLELSEFLDDLGLKWCNGSSYIDLDNWYMYMEDTCYFFNEGTYGDATYAENEGYTILEFSELGFDTTEWFVDDIDKDSINTYLSEFAVRKEPDHAV